MKKILALCLISGMITSPLSALAFSDVSDSPYKSEIEFFEKEGIIKGKGDSKFYPQDKLTRAETAKICAGIVPHYYFEETKPVFADVLYEHWAAKEVGAMVYSFNSFTPESVELLSEEHSQRLFYPEKAVTAEYILDVCLEILGYRAIKEEPDIGYENTIKKAKESGLLNGIDVIEGQEIKRDEAMKIFYNTINAPLVLTEGLSYNEELGKFVTNVKIMDGSSEDTPFMSLWMYKQKKR